MAQPLCRNVSGILLYKFWRLLPGIFLEDFLGTFSHKNEEKESGDKIRETIQRLKSRNQQNDPFCQEPALTITISQCDSVKNAGVS